MNLNDILTLAHAGYTAAQINQFTQPQQMPVQQMPQVQQMPVQQMAQQMPVQQMPQVQQMPVQQMPQVQQMPVQQMPQVQQMAHQMPVQQMSVQQMPVQQMPQVQQKIPDVPITFDIKKTDPNDAMKQMASALASAQQANLALLSGQNPTLSQVQTADDVTSQIIKEGI